jgi:FkbH-like protein
MKVPNLLELKANLKKASPALPKVKVALLGDFATQMLNTAIRGMAIEYNLAFDLFEAEFNQIDQQVFDTDSELYKHEPNFIIICKSGENLEAKFLGLKNEKRADFANTEIQYFENIVETIQQQLPNSKIIAFNFPANFDLSLGHFALKSKSSFRYQLHQLNLKLMELSISLGNLFLLDVDALQAQYGYNARIEQKFYIKSNLIYSLNFLPLIAKHVLDIIGAIRGTHLHKCLILDLDNTTWGGIIGDDGIEKIQVGDLGNGKAFSNLQKWAKSLKQRGIILCVCSKNTEGVAQEPFLKHPEMVLRLEDIAVFVANWENKADNIRYIQSVLNIGFDSMVFLDDNPFERNLVRTELPKVIVPELPEDPTEYVAYLRTLNLFETASLSKQDEERTEQYQQEAKRLQIQAKYSSIDEYLEQLDMSAVCAPFDKFSIPRIAQLTQRSNQFNLRTIRYTEQEVEAVQQDSNKLGFQISLEDKFGDYGLISLIIGEKRGKSLFIDTWIMSCRVLKRGVENYVLNQIVVQAKALGLSEIVGEYIPTPKNDLVKDHYKNLGFSQEGETHIWKLKTGTFAPHQNFIKTKHQ